MQTVASAEARAGLGLDHDCNQDPASPRQVLLVSAAVVATARLAAGDLRGNLVVEGDVDALPSGTVLRTGDVRLRITLACESCALLERVRPGLAREVRATRGRLARVVTSGRLVPGAAVEVEPDRQPPLAERWQARVAAVIAQVPPGQILTYAQLATVVGVQRSYCRAFPPLLRQLATGSALPVHRVVPADLRRIAPDHAPRLRAEGVDLQAPMRWDGASSFGD